MNAEEFFTRLAEAIDAAPGSSKRAPARLKARVYSALVVEQAARGPLLSLPATLAGGRPLCVFEQVLHVVPNERIASVNPCRVCHARVLAEHFESPPIYWPNCPYVGFRSQ